VCVPTITFGGVTEIPEQAWSIVENLAGAYGDDWWYAGMLAFVRQDQRRWAEAEQLSERALATEQASGHAAHALAHVFYETGRHLDGLSWLDDWIAGSGRSACHGAHFSWHAALHELALERLDEVRRRYATQLAPPHVYGMRALVDSISLLWRCRLAGIWSAEDLPAGPILDTVPPKLLGTPSTPFTAMHAAFAYAATGDLEGLERLRRFAQASSHPVIREVIAPLADGLRAYLLGYYADAVTNLTLVWEHSARLGGSAAQHEIIEDTLISSMIHAGRCRQALHILQGRLDRRPSMYDRRQLVVAQRDSTLIQPEGTSE
jgi:hypothetical protein